MKENNELERSDIAIDRDMEVDCDIGQEKVIGILCSQGFAVEVADSGTIYENHEETQSEESDQGFTMGGIQ